MRRNVTFLGHKEWGPLSRACLDERLFTCDMRDTVRVYPPGVVALALVTHHRAASGWQTRIQPPEDDGVLTYLGRIDFFDQIHSDAHVVGDLSWLQGHRRRSSEGFSELIAARDQRFDDVAEVVWNHLQEEAPDEAQPTFTAFEELLSNIEQHSAPSQDQPAQSFVQVQAYQGEIDLAFGDLGVGYRASLRENPDLHALADEAEALRGVLVEGHSRFRNREERGGGLRYVARRVRGLRGRMKILSGDGLARCESGRDDRAPGRQDRLDPKLSTIDDAFPGTMAWIQLPRSGGERPS